MYLRVSPYLELLEGIAVALQVNEGIIKLTGRDGAGKSALCQALSESLVARGLHVLYFPVPPATVDILQTTILESFGLQAGPNFTKQLTRHLQDQSGVRRQLHVIFDKAEDIDEAVFNSIRMLCNIQDEHRALVKPIICGSSALDRKLTDIRYRSVSQYLSQSFTLSPMTIEQLKNFYWEYWLQSGIQVKPPGSTVVNKLFKESQGFPGPVLSRLQLANQRVIERRQGRSAEPTLVQPVLAPRKSATTWLALSFGLVLVGAGGGMYYLYDRVETKPTPRVSLPPPAAEAVEAGVQVVAATVEVMQQAAEPGVTAAPEPPPVPATAGPETPESAESFPAAATGEPPVVAEDEPEAAGEPLPERAPAPQSELLPEDGPVADSTPLVEAEAVAESTPAVEVTPEIPTALAAAEALLAAWTSNWQARDVDGYLGHYHQDFEPAGGATREAWQEQRRGSIGRATDIRISYDSIEVVAEDETSLTLQLWLHYSASNYADDTLKELVLLKSDTGLQIRSETNLLVERPQ